MGRYVFALVIAGFCLVFGLVMFPSMKSMFGFNDTTGFSYLLSAGYASLPYILAFFIGFAAFLAVRSKGR
jgi:hypothetical protein